MTAPQKFPDIPWALIQALHSAFPPNRSGDSPNSLLQRIGELRFSPVALSTEEENRLFVESLTFMGRRCYENSKSKGFWPDQSAIVSETAEALTPGAGGIVRQDVEKTLNELLAKFNVQNGRNKGEQIALMHSELSEQLEGIRKPAPDSHVPEYTSEEVEAADLFIRLMDYAGGHKLRLAEAVLAKMQFNATRPFKHGKTC